MKKIILLILPLSIFAQSYDVLFLGNSYTFYNQMPNMVSEIATSMGDTVVAESNTPWGWKLEQSISKDKRINLSTLTQVGQYIVELRSEYKVNTFKLIKN